MTRRIIHLDLDAFFCSVEEKRDPTLRGQPFAVGGRPDQRGVVASCSYAARKFGVRSAMPTARAIRICPDLQLVRGHYQAYREESRRVMAILKSITPLVEQISIDEAFLDVSALGGDAVEQARRLQAQIRDTLSLPSSLGVATNKLVAKIANDVGKGQYRGEGPPYALTIVRPGEEARFLAPLPVRALWGIGPKTEEKLMELGIATIGELAAADPSELTRLFGRHGSGMVRRAQGIDPSPIVTHREAKSISQEVTFPRDVRNEVELRKAVGRQAATVAGRLKKLQMTAGTVRIKIRWPDFTTHSRQLTTTLPVQDAAEIARLAWRLVEKVWQPGTPVRLIGVGVSRLQKDPAQLALWDFDKEQT